MSDEKDKIRKTRRSIVWEGTYTKGREDGYKHGKDTGKDGGDGTAADKR